MNFLIIRLSSMGDVIHTLPALRALRATFPGSRIGWAVEDTHASILYGLPELDHLYVLPREGMKAGWGSLRRVGREMKTRMRQVEWDVAIDFQGLWKSLAMIRWSGAKRSLGYAPSPERTHWFYTDRVRLPTMDRHAVDRNLDLVASLGVSVRHAEERGEFRRDFRFPISPSDRQAASALVQSLDLPSGSPRVLLNFSARKPANRWGTERFAALAESLDEKGFAPILTGGPGDSDEEAEIQSRFSRPVRSLVGKCSLNQLAAVMNQVDAMVTGDTGPMHIAVAMDLPVVALFGPANPVRTGPYSPDAVILQKPYDCQPCYGRHCKLKQEPPPCLTDIEVEEVVAEVERALSPHEGVRSFLLPRPDSFRLEAKGKT